MAVGPSQPNRADSAPMPGGEELPAALARAEVYGDGVGPVEVRETHISRVFLVGDRAFKLKKPLTLPFLDYGSPQLRREMCNEEVRLNRALAPAVYLGVRAVLRTPEGFRLGPEDHPDAVDYVVEMARYDEAHTMAGRLASGELRTEQAEAVGKLLAGFHQGAERLTLADPTRSAGHVVTANLRDLLELVYEQADAERILSLGRFARRFLAAHSALIDDRAHRGLVRVGHGDVRADHVLLTSPPQVVDCIEFSHELRELDVADDLAFLVMDLVARGGDRFARALVDAYQHAGGDPGPNSLLAFYACHRALVRVKAALLRDQQRVAATSSEPGSECATADHLLAVAERFSWCARTPLVIVICGLPATGKSRLSARLSAISALAHLNSDITRKRLAGLEPQEHAGDRAYTPEFSRRTYAALGREAAEQVADSGGAVVDATFRRRADRDAFREGFRNAAPVVFVECIAPPAVLRQRAAARDREQVSVSDASLAVVERERHSWEALDEVHPDSHLVLRSDRDPDVQLAEITELLDARLARLLAHPVEQPHPG